MFGISGTELVIILLFAFLIVGPEKLPKWGRIIGRAIRQFRNAQDEVNRVIKSEVYDPIMDSEPLKNPSDILSGRKSSGKKRQVRTTSSESSETFAERRARLARERAAHEYEEAETASVGGAASFAAESGVDRKSGAVASGVRTNAKAIRTAGATGKPAGAESSAAASQGSKPVKATITVKPASAGGAETFAERRARLAKARADRASAEAAAAGSAVRGSEDATAASAASPAAASAPTPVSTNPSPGFAAAFPVFSSNNFADSLYGLVPEDAADSQEGRKRDA